MAFEVDKLFKKKKDNKFAKGVAVGGAAVAGIVAAAAKLHQKGYDKKALKMLKDASDKLKKEAEKLETKVKRKTKPKKASTSVRKTSVKKPAKKKRAKASSKSSGKKKKSNPKK